MGDDTDWDTAFSRLKNGEEQMNIALVYYSFSGNTHSAVIFFRQALEEKTHQIQTVRLKLSREESSFFKQCRDAFLKKEAELSGCEYSLKQYDFIIFATPVWAFTITPALRSYLSKADGLKNKKVGFILTFGSGAGANKTKKELERILKDKGATVEFSLGLKGNKIKDKEYLRNEFSSLTKSYGL